MVTRATRFAIGGAAGRNKSGPSMPRSPGDWDPRRMTSIELSDRRARTVIVAAERIGFRRPAGFHPRQYDAFLHEHAVAARTFLSDRHPSELDEALSQPDPLSADEAAERLTNGRATLADVERIITAAEAIGFTAPQPELPLGDFLNRFEQGRAAVAFLWTTKPAILDDVLGEAALLAPTPDDAWIPCPTCGQ